MKCSSVNDQLQKYAIKTTSRQCSYWHRFVHNMQCKTGISPVLLMINWCLTAHQHRKVNLCQQQGRETGSVGKGWPTRYNALRAMLITILNEAILFKAILTVVCLKSVIMQSATASVKVPNSLVIYSGIVCFSLGRVTTPLLNSIFE